MFSRYFLVGRELGIKIIELAMDRDKVYTKITEFFEKQSGCVIKAFDIHILG